MLGVSGENAGSDKMKFIKLSKGEHVIVSNVDFAKLNKFSWHVSDSGHNLLYARAWIRGKHVYMHRYIMKPRKGQITHHKDGGTLNCMRSNMKNVSETQHKKWFS